MVISTDTSIRTIYRVVSSGGSFGSNSLQQEIGIAEYDKIDSLIISWPNSNALQYFIDVPINKHYLINEQKGISDMQLPSFSFDLNEHQHMHH
ncbi:MAG: ASPIC/UnbV domain-containing protein [Flavobacteriales bacterium]|nr:ASPIC/UnbV domain-containing protein [Flavobacteriales bacterium]